MPTAGAGATWVDVIDADDRVIGAATRAEMRARRLRHRAVFVVVVSPRGEVLVHRRAHDKDLWPGRWDFAVGGVVERGESYDAAAARELAEEVGVHGAELLPIGAGAFEDDDVALVGRVYRVKHPGPFTFADGEVIEARFVDVGELRARLARDPFVPDTPAIVLALLARALA